MDLLRWLRAAPKPLEDPRLPDPPPSDAFGRHLWSSATWDGNRGVYQEPQHGRGDIAADNAAKRRWLARCAGRRR